ncbi:putative isomerase [Terrimicrobium sacchariphilum]|uniref:Putative isomerase n=1 Tax=Terrimicrobium sacchariphilum TaxID=690879 RepID=A0A146G651_TERSA|nr:trehalase family glycosidase [Terrimicrobium sacchariphilum]GAT32278.1 putative isomerase [Terrimicrobium sacchariphilum]
MKIEDYIASQIGTTLRNPMGILEHPFIVPGGIFHDELWDWDSFWIAKGLLLCPAFFSHESRATWAAHAVGSWRNFFESQAPNGTVSIMIKSDNVDFFSCRNDDQRENNQAKPVFAQFALDISEATGDYDWVAPYFDSLLLFYQRWESRYQSPCGLFVWGSDVAIGVDCDPTTYGRPEFSSANLLLNCLFHKDLLAAAKLARELGRTSDAIALTQRAQDLAAAIIRECWDDLDGFFYTVDVQCADHRDHYLPGIQKGMDMGWRSLPLKVRMFTGFLPLWSGVATPEQAAILVNSHLRDERSFSANWGIRSLSKTERMYSPGTNSANPSNWLGPIWIVANYMIYEGLRNYGYHSDAATLARKTRALLENDLAATGTLHECYHPDSAQPNFNSGFISWNVLALLMETEDQTS